MKHVFYTSLGMLLRGLEIPAKSTKIIFHVTYITILYYIKFSIKIMIPHESMLSLMSGPRKAEQIKVSLLSK